MLKSLRDFSVIFKKLGLVVIIYSICRLAFYLFNKQYFDSEGLAIAFLGGIRFDLVAIAYINLAFVFLSLLPFSFTKSSKYINALHWLFIISNAAGILFNCIDIEYFKFTLKRSTFDLFTLMGTGDDLKNLVPQFLKDYWYLLLLFALLIFLLHRWSIKLSFGGSPLDRRKKDFLPRSVIFFFAIGLMVLMGRGGFQLRPLALIHATEYGKIDKMPLVLNTPFSIIRSYGADYLTPKEYYQSPEESRAFFDAKKAYGNEGRSKDNVVIILLESFSSEFLNCKGDDGEYLTPFMDSLRLQSVRFERAYANGKKSVEGVPSVCSSLPSLMTNPYIFSPYSANNVNSLASILGKEGYGTSFFHGGNNGTMGFDAFAKSSGFDNYYGKDEYPLEGHDDGTWGIFDEEYFQYFSGMLDKKEQPFFSLVFSLTSHHPFKVPERYESRFSKSKNKYAQVIQYTDYSLKRFFEDAKKKDWYDNTLFIITADHTAQSSDEYYRNREGMFRIPLIIYHPTKLSPIKSRMIAQQVDILPSVIDFLGVEKEIITFGKSLFRNQENYCVQYLNGIYQIQNEKYHLAFNGEKTVSIYNLKNDSLLKSNLVDSLSAPKFDLLERRLKAVIQEYTSRMINNKLTAE